MYLPYVRPAASKWAQHNGQTRTTWSYGGVATRRLETLLVSRSGEVVKPSIAANLHDGKRRWLKMLHFVALLLSPEQLVRFNLGAARNLHRSRQGKRCRTMRQFARALKSVRRLHEGRGKNEISGRRLICWRENLEHPSREDSRETRTQKSDPV